MRIIRVNRIGVAAAIFIPIIAIGTLVFLLSGRELSESRIHEILEESLKEPANSPYDACLSLKGMPKLPGKVASGNLEAQADLVSSLIKNGLIRVNTNVGKGRAPSLKPGYDSVGPQSYVSLTQFGAHYYRDQPVGNNPVMVDSALFCARVEVGSVLKFMPPLKNPFDDNPHRVTWAKFLWNIDEKSTPWLSDPTLKNAIPFFKIYLSSRDEHNGWHEKGILLEEFEEQHWRLGENPYTIRW